MVGRDSMCSIAHGRTARSRIVLSVVGNAGKHSWIARHNCRYGGKKKHKNKFKSSVEGNRFIVWECLFKDSFDVPHQFSGAEKTFIKTAVSWRP